MMKPLPPKHMEAKEPPKSWKIGRAMNTQKSVFSLLLIDDEALVLSSLKRTFFEYDYAVHTAQSGAAALSLLETAAIDAAVIDLKMPGMDGLALLREIRKKYPAVMCLMLTGHGGVRDAVEAIKLGALDFLEKPYGSDELCSRIDELRRIWEWGGKGGPCGKAGYAFQSLLGESSVMTELRTSILQVAVAEANVLVSGETGTGKEMVARALHHHSNRSSHPFVVVDCAALSETVIESELFGHAKGAFTGAHTARSGLVVTADGGTLFLDEIGEFPLLLQPKLLRVLQEKEVRPVGSNRSRQVDVRIVSATNRDLDQEVAEGRFRRDLYYRINVIGLHSPPLRDRREDIPLLARHFLDRYLSEHTFARSISAGALDCLQSYAWPGNVRELENVIQRALVLTRGDTIAPGDLPPRIGGGSIGGEPGPFQSLPQSGMMEIEKNAIGNALRMSGNNRKKAAQSLGISEATLYRKIRKYRIEV